MPEYTVSKSPDKTPFDWRAHLAVHNAAELFPLMPEAELRELAEDIRANGLRAPIITWEPEGLIHGPVLLDGRNRLDALALLGLLYETPDHHLGVKKWNGREWCIRWGDRIHFQGVYGGDPYAIALSLNVLRRHLTSELRRESIAKVFAQQSTSSDRQIGVIVKADHKTVGSVRREMEARGELPHVEVRTDTEGRKQPAKKKPVPKKATKAGAAKPEHKGVSAKDTALDEFDGHVLRLLQMVKNAKPERFAKTGVPGSGLSELSRFLAEVAGAVKAASSTEEAV
jgi:hypothetical protein